MEVRKSEYEWKRGVGKFQFSKDGKKVRLGLFEHGEHVPEDNLFTFSRELLPKAPKEIKPNTPYYVVFTLRDEEVFEIDEILPVGWSEENVKLVNMTRPNNDQSQPPTPYTTDTAWGEEERFYMFYQVVDEDSKNFGCIFPIMYKYMFTHDPATGNTQLSSDPERSKWARKLIEHLGALMDIDTPIQYPDDGNVLPNLLQRGLAESKVITMSGKVGKYSKDSGYAGKRKGDWGTWLEVTTFVALRNFNEPKAEAEDNGFGEELPPVDEAFPQDNEAVVSSTEDFFDDDEDEFEEDFE